MLAAHADIPLSFQGCGSTLTVVTAPDNFALGLPLGDPSGVPPDGADKYVNEAPILG